MNWIRRLFGKRRRVSTKLTPKYEAARLRTIRKAQAMFPGASNA